MLAPALVLTLSLSAAAPPAIVLARVTGEGMSDEDAAAARTRIEEELQLMGAQPVATDAQAEPACFDDAACVHDLAGEHPAVLRVELLRVGPLVQVTAYLYGRDGALLYETDRSVNAEGISATGTLLGPEIAPHIRALADSETEPESESESEAESESESEAASDAAPLFVPLVAVGGTLAALGVLTAVVGGVIAAERTATAYTPTTPGDDKALALAIAPWATGAAVGGVALALAGGGVLAAAFVVE